MKIESRLKALIEEVRIVAKEIRSLKESQKPTISLDIPPLWVRKAALSFQGFKTWPEAYKILCDYYSIPLLGATVNPNKVPEGSVACFVWEDHSVYTKDESMRHDTGIHEFFHYLCFCAGKSYHKGPSEAMTNAYVQEFLAGVE